MIHHLTVSSSWYKEIGNLLLQTPSELYSSDNGLRSSENYAQGFIKGDASGHTIWTIIN